MNDSEKKSWEENKNKYEEKTILLGYYGESHPCNNCVARRGKAVADFHQPIYLTVSHLEKDYSKMWTDKKVAENYCFPCAREQMDKWYLELGNFWSKEHQRN